MGVSLPDARDSDALDVEPTRTLRDSSSTLGDRAELDRRYVEEGYLFFRGLLPVAAIDEARAAMMAPLVTQGLIDGEGRWTGGTRPTLHEEGEVFAGIWPRLFAYPGVADALAQLLGEPVVPVPIVQYRAYPSHRPLGRIHQDGFSSPGIQGFRPIWLPLVDMDRSMGGLALAIGQTRRGFLHNLAKPPRYPIPAGLIDDDAWGWTDYRRGDVLVIHPSSPHVGLPNRSDRLRFSIDTRVQSAANPATIVGELVRVDDGAVTLKMNGEFSVLTFDRDTFIRTGPRPGYRLTLDEFVADPPLGRVILAAREGDRALMLRRAAAG